MIRFPCVQRAVQPNFLKTKKDGKANITRRYRARNEPQTDEAKGKMGSERGGKPSPFYLDNDEILGVGRIVQPVIDLAQCSGEERRLRGAARAVRKRKYRAVCLANPPSKIPQEQNE